MLLQMVKFISVYVLGLGLCAGVLFFGILAIISLPDEFRYRVLLPTLVGAVMAFCWWLTCCAPSYFLAYPPQPGQEILSRTEVMDRIETAFRDVDQGDGQRLFEIARSGDRMVLTWSDKIAYSQLISVGERGLKRIYSLYFSNDAAVVSYTQKDVDWSWKLSSTPDVFNMGMNIRWGVWVEWSKKIIPSIGYGPDGKLFVDVKTLTYSSNDLFVPLRGAINSAGWTLRADMMPISWQRHLSILLFGLFFFALTLYGVEKHHKALRSGLRARPALSDVPSNPHDIDQGTTVRLQSLMSQPSPKAQAFAKDLDALRAQYEDDVERVSSRGGDPQAIRSELTRLSDKLQQDLASLKTKYDYK